jgi:hypothetical protein
MFSATEERKAGGFMPEGVAFVAEIHRANEAHAACAKNCDGCNDADQLLADNAENWTEQGRGERREMHGLGLIQQVSVFGAGFGFKNLRLTNNPRWRA